MVPYATSSMVPYFRSPSNMEIQIGHVCKHFKLHWVVYSGLIIPYELQLQSTITQPEVKFFVRRGESSTEM